MALPSFTLCRRGRVAILMRKAVEQHGIVGIEASHPAIDPWLDGDNLFRDALAWLRV
jgi:hypothetical protein